MIDISDPKISVADIVDRIQQEDAETIILPRIPALAPLSPKDSYRLDEFLACHDQEFVVNAYRGILKREPDAGGLASYLGKLRSGSRAKLEILGDLRYSDEGRKNNVRIRSLRSRLFFNRLYQLPLIGYFLHWLSNLVRLPTVIRYFRNLDCQAQGYFTQLQQLLNEQAEHTETAFNAVLRQSQQQERLLRDLEMQQAALIQQNRGLQEEYEKLAQSLPDLHARQEERWQHVQQLEARQEERWQYVQQLEARQEERWQHVQQLEARHEDRWRHNQQVEMWQEERWRHVQQLEARQEERWRHTQEMEMWQEERWRHTQRLETRLDESQQQGRQSLSYLEESSRQLQQLQTWRSDLDTQLQEYTRRLEIMLRRVEQTEMSKADRGQVGQLVQRVKSLESSCPPQPADTGESTALAELRLQLVDYKRSLIDQQYRLLNLLERFSEPSLPPGNDRRQPQLVAEEEEHWLDALYVTFEDYFRGPRQQVKENLKVYLPYLQQARAGIPEAPVLDVGCGRGEWLELLREQGLAVRGLDINRVMVRECQLLGLDVVEADVIAYLSQVEANSLSAVTGFHIIEHLPLKIFIELLDEVRRVLKPGGVAIFETPNPENIIVGAYTFYLDPTHRNPLPPIAVQRLAEIRGFVKADILRLHRRDETGANDPLVEKWFRTETDYALICHK